MARKKVLASVLVVVLAACVGSVAQAQDMVFTNDDVGEVAAPPPPPSGPPSEALANALRLYQQESYDQAAVQFQRIVQGETGDEPANVQKAQFFLGKCLYHLKFYQAALGVFEEIAMMSTGHIHFRTTMQWLAQLSRELPEPAGIISLVGRYGDSLAALEEFNKPETKPLYNELLFLMGRHWYQQGEYTKARDFFLELDRNSEQYTPGVFFAGITYVRERTAQPAAKAFLSIVKKYEGKLFLSDEEERYLNLAWLTLARLYYSTKHFSSAIAAWGEVPQASEYYLDAVFDESWAYFQTDQLQKALGNIHTIDSPYFAEKFYPEALVLRSVIYFGQCQYDDAQAAVDQFREKYEPIQNELDVALKQFQDNESFFKFLQKLRNMDDIEEAAEGSADKKIMGFSVPVLYVIKLALSDRTLLKNLEYVEILEREEKRLAAKDKQFVGSSAGVRIQQDINTAKSVAMDNTGDLARSRYERLLGEIKDLNNQVTRVEIEILKAVRGELEMEIETGDTATGPTVEVGKIVSDKEHVLWPFTGEFWRDELGFYQQPIVNNCGR